MGHFGSELLAAFAAKKSIEFLRLHLLDFLLGGAIVTPVIRLNALLSPARILTDEYTRLGLADAASASLLWGTIVNVVSHEILWSVSSDPRVSVRGAILRHCEPLQTLLPVCWLLLPIPARTAP